MRAKRVTMVAVSILALSASVALAWTISSIYNPGNSVTAASVGTVGILAATPSTGFPSCDSEVLTWTAATNATAYRVEYQNDGTAGTWTNLTPSTGALTYIDTNAGTHLNSTVNYRVTPLLTPGSWNGTPSIVSVQCGIGRVRDLAITNQCTNNVLTWTTPHNTTGTYAVSYSTDGGGTWNAPTNIAATTVGSMSYMDLAAPILTRGTTYMYRVTPSSGAGSVSAGSNSITWDNFHVDALVIGNASATALASGDTVRVDFSKSVVMGATADVNKMTVTPRRNLFVANAGTTTNNGVGWFNNSANIWTNAGNVTSTWNGTGAWSALGGWSSSRLTWTSDGTVTAGGAQSQSASLSGTGWTNGAGQAQCDPTPATLPPGTIAKVNLVPAPTGVVPTYTGRF